MDQKQTVISTRGRIPPVVIILLVACFFIPVTLQKGYIMHLCVVICIASALATNFNLAAGYAGQTSFAHSAFYGIGAYTVAILNTRFGINLWACLPIAFSLATLIAFLLGLPTLRLRGTYRVICTIGFQIIFDTLVLKLMKLTNGPVGITGIDVPEIFGFSLLRPSAYFYVVMVWLVINLALLWRIESSRTGFELLALKSDEHAALSCGINVPTRKLWAFSTSAGMAAVTGCLFAGYMRTVSPSSFNLAYSAVILCMSLFGGSGTIFGGMIGAITLGVIPEIFRPIQEYRMILYGSAMVIMVLFMPNGLIGLINSVHSRLTEKKGGEELVNNIDS